MQGFRLPEIGFENSNIACFFKDFYRCTLQLCLIFCAVAYILG